MPIEPTAIAAQLYRSAVLTRESRGPGEGERFYVPGADAVEDRLELSPRARAAAAANTPAQAGDGSGEAMGQKMPDPDFAREAPRAGEAGRLLPKGSQLDIRI